MAFYNRQLNLDLRNTEATSTRTKSSTCQNCTMTLLVLCIPILCILRTLSWQLIPPWHVVTSMWMKLSPTCTAPDLTASSNISIQTSSQVNKRRMLLRGDCYHVRADYCMKTIVYRKHTHTENISIYFNSTTTYNMNNKWWGPSYTEHNILRWGGG